MSDVYDRFGGDRAWDIHVAREDDQMRAYRRFVRDKTCVDDCDNCRIPDIHDERFKFYEIGFCPEIEDFVGQGDTPLKFGCETFTGASL